MTNNQTYPGDKLFAGHRDLTLLVYVLLALGFFTGGLTALAAIVVNYLKIDEVRGSWLESHFRWQMNTFWYGLLWYCFGWVSWLLLLGWLVWAVTAVWAIYRIVKGLLNLNDHKPMLF